MQGNPEEVYYVLGEIYKPFFLLINSKFNSDCLAVCKLFVIHWFIIQIRWLPLEMSPGASQQCIQMEW